MANHDEKQIINKMKIIIILILNTLLFLNCVAQDTIKFEEIALNYLFENKRINLDNSKLIINEDLQNYKYKDNIYFSFLENCYPQGGMFELNKYVKIIKNWNDVSYKLPPYEKTDSQDIKTNIFVTIYKKLLTEDNEYIVIINCLKRTKSNKRKSENTYYIFLNDLGIVTNCYYEHLVYPDSPYWNDR